MANDLKIKCPFCDGEIEYSAGDTSCTCDYCASVVQLPAGTEVKEEAAEEEAPAQPTVTEPQITAQPQAPVQPRESVQPQAPVQPTTTAQPEQVAVQSQASTQQSSGWQQSQTYSQPQTYNWQQPQASAQPQAYSQSQTQSWQSTQQSRMGMQGSAMGMPGQGNMYSMPVKQPMTEEQKKKISNYVLIGLSAVIGLIVIISLVHIGRVTYLKNHKPDRDGFEARTKTIDRGFFTAEFPSYWKEIDDSGNYFRYIDKENEDDGVEFGFYYTMNDLDDSITDDDVMEEFFEDYLDSDYIELQEAEERSYGELDGAWYYASSVKRSGYKDFNCYYYVGELEDYPEYLIVFTLTQVEDATYDYTGDLIETIKSVEAQ